MFVVLLNGPPKNAIHTIFFLIECSGRKRERERERKRKGERKRKIKRKRKFAAIVNPENKPTKVK